MTSEEMGKRLGKVLGDVLSRMIEWEGELPLRIKARVVAGADGPEIDYLSIDCPRAKATECAVPLPVMVEGVVEDFPG